MSHFDIVNARTIPDELRELQKDLHGNPIALLEAWIDEAFTSGTKEANTMALATVGEQGAPHVRVVLLRGLDEQGLRFYTSYLSRKAHDLLVNPRAAAAFYWAAIGRQVTVEGPVERLSETESDRYFASRPRGHQLSAWASEQSESIESREILEARLRDYDDRFEGAVPRPHSWGGFLLRPERFEFWQARANRLHDRVEFLREGADWRPRRLQP